MPAVRLLFFFFFSLFVLISLFNPSSPLSDQPETDALLKFKNSLTHADALDDWVSGSGSHPCETRWVGLICFGGIITGLHLSDLSLSGNVDIEALQQLRGLRTISFMNNSFEGPIPEFNKLGTLKSLLLSQNKFSGEIPVDFFSPMASLKKVWLSDNQFTGKIPDSVMQLPHLKELHLERNQFSGPIPELNDPRMIASLDLSYNKLEGQIPESFSVFSSSAFAGNDGLCGKPLTRDCDATQTRAQASPPEPTGSSSDDSSKFSFEATALALLAFLLLFTICLAKRRQKDEDFSILEKDNLGGSTVPIVRVHGSSKKPMEWSRKGGGSSKRSSHHGKNGMSDLMMVNEEKGRFGLPDLMKAAAEVLGNGGLGSAYKATMANGLTVVVKRIKEMNVMGREVFEAEMRRFGRIRHRNILMPLAYHFRKEEKLLVSEYIPKGSLLYVLHGDRGICHANLNWQTRLKIIKGIVSGLGFLHSEYSTYNLPHGNLKSSNVLLTEEYEPLLTDYALDPLVNPNHAAQAMFAYKSPESVQNHQVSPKSDVYCLGIIILEVVTGKFPSQYLSSGKGGIDVIQWVAQASNRQELIDPEIANAAKSLDHMVQLLQIGVACAESNPSKRLDLNEAIRRIGNLPN